MPTRRRTSPDAAAPRRDPASAPTAPSGADAGPDDWNPDATPYVEGYDLAPDSVPAMVGVGVPAVVAVVATRNPGPWLESTLTSIASQEYANLTTLVVDAGSIADPTERVANVLPNAFVKHIEAPSFAQAANAALGTIEGASFFLFCHDDVELGPGAVQAMVEEAFRSNAGVVGAKLVDWDDPEHLRSVGGSIDKFGFSWPIAEVNELDQAQHDAVREAFVVSTAAMLVRCDLFADLGGFSTDIDGSGEDLDLCWRARVAGARTVVMPAAVVRHRERSELGDPTGRDQALVLRNQTRIILACYTPLTLLRIVPQATVLAVLDMLAALARGRLKVARAVGSSLVWNLGHLPTTFRIRAGVKRTRRTSDHEIRRMQIKGSARLIGFVRQVTSGDRSVTETLAAAARGLPGTRDEGPEGALWALGAFVVTAVLLLVGSRTLFIDGIPQLREFAPMGSPSQLLSEWWSGWRTPGLGGAAGAPTLDLIARLASWLTFGATGMARTLLILAALPLGAASAWRLLRGCASYPARAAALLGYLVNPIPYNAISEGRWQALVVYGACPAILGRVARAGAWAPFDEAEPVPGSPQRQAVGLGLVLAAAATVAPVVCLVAMVICAVVVASMSSGARDGHPARAVGVTAGGLGVSAVLHLPWTLAVLTSSNRWSVLTGADPSRLRPVPLGRAVLFDTGTHGGAVTGGLVLTAVVALLISSKERFRWAATASHLLLVSMATVVLAGRLAPSRALPVPEVTLSVGAAGVALAFALGVEAFRADVVGKAFGWRQLLSVVAVAAVTVASVPLVVDLLDGRWLAPVSDVGKALGPIDAKGVVPNERTLWIGDADALGTSGWRLDDGMKFALTDGIDPNFSSLFPQGPGDGERALRAVLSAAEHGGSARLGSRLAPFGIRYVVVLSRLAPRPYGTRTYPISPGLGVALAEQFDLAQVDVSPGIRVYQNLARLDIRSTTDVSAAEALAKPGSVATLVDKPLGTEPWKVVGEPPTRYVGQLPVGRSLMVLSTRDDGWRLVGESTARPEALLGWASAFDTGPGGRATLEYETPPAQVVLHVIQMLALLTLPWFRRRRVSEFRVRLARSRSERRGATPRAEVV